MANGKITLQMLSDMMSSATGRTKTSTELFTRHFFSTIKEALLRDNIIKIKGFGTFKMVVVNARESINVNTGERVSIAEYNKISFTPDKNLKERINRPFAQFDTITIEDEELEIIEDSVSSTKKMTKQTVMPEPSIEPKSSNENLDLKNDNPTEISDDAISNENIQPNDDIESNDEVESNDNKNTENEAETNDSLQDTSSTEVPQSSEDDMPTNDDNSKQSHKKAFILILLSLVIAAAGYMVGYLHLFDFDFRKVLKTSEATSVKTNKVGSDKAKDSETQKNVTKDTLQANLTQTNIPPEANDYPQIADGKYYIVGIKTYRKIKSDYNIKRYCLQIYGNTEILPYVLLINNIDNPDNVAVGKIIKFPILVTK